MAWVPTPRDEVDHVAMPETVVADPRVVVASRKMTEPMGAEPALLMEAVKTTAFRLVVALDDEITEVVVQ